MAGRKIIADTSGVIALLDRDDQYHFIVVEAISEEDFLCKDTPLLENICREGIAL